MHKYLLRFFKHGNMRFISHLDLGRLFRRAIKKAEIDVAYSNGFNPHEKINIVQPLSLGFEGDSEFFEITTNSYYVNKDLKDLLNKGMPEDILFYDCREIDISVNMSNKSESAVYHLKILSDRYEYRKIDVDAFMSQEEILIKKRDKKTKKFVDRSIKNLIVGPILKSDFSGDGYSLTMILKCASNESLNPLNLLASLYGFCGAELKNENVRVSRRDILTKNNHNDYVSLFDFDYDKPFGAYEDF